MDALEILTIIMLIIWKVDCVFTYDNEIHSPLSSVSTIGKGRLHNFNYGLYWPLWDLICGTRYRDRPATATVATPEERKLKSTWFYFTSSQSTQFPVPLSVSVSLFDNECPWPTYMSHMSYQYVCSDHCLVPFSALSKHHLFPRNKFSISPSYQQLNLFDLVRSFFFSFSTRRWQKNTIRVQTCERKERQTKQERERESEWE